MSNNNKKIISLQLPEDLILKLKEQANKDGRNISSEIRYILNIYLNKI